MASSVNSTHLFDTVSEVLDGILKDAQNQIRQFNEHAGVIRSLKAFVAAVDWNERWIQCLLAFHLALLVLVFAFRRNMAVQGTVFFSIMPAVYMAERLNGWLAQHWQHFATQPYFDKRGIFMSAVYSAPLLFTMFVVLINYLVATGDVLIQMKRRQIRYELRQKARAQAENGEQLSPSQAAEEKKER